MQYSEIRLHVQVEPDEENSGYTAVLISGKGSGLVGQGDTKQAALDDLREAILFTLRVET